MLRSVSADSPAPCLERPTAGALAAAGLAIALAACGPGGRASPMPNASPARPTKSATSAATAEWLSRGEAVYLRECASCHGERGEGQPDWAVTLPDGSLPASPHDASGHTWHHSDAELLDIVTRGGKFYLPASTMPAFGPKLSQDDMRAALAHIKTFWGPKETSYQVEMTAQEEARRETQQVISTATP